MEGRLKFSDKDEGVILIDGDPFLEIVVDATSANLTNWMGDHDRRREQ